MVLDSTSHKSSKARDPLAGASHSKLLGRFRVNFVGLTFSWQRLDHFVWNL